MKKKYLIPTISFIIGAGCFIAYAIIGSSVAEDGTLIEPFGLIPLGWFFIFAAIVSGIIMGIMSKFRRKSNTKGDINNGNN